MYIFCIIDTINALINSKSGSNYEEVEKWSEQYCKLYLGQVYEVICVNLAQFNNTVRTSQFANQGFKIEEKHEPTLGHFGTVTTTPNDHTLVLSLFKPYNYGISKHQGYDISRLKGNYIRLNIMKNSFGKVGPDITTHLFFEGEKGQFTEMPPADQTAQMKPFYDKCALYGK